MLGPDVEFILSRAQSIQQEAASPVLTAEHLSRALAALPGGGAGGHAQGGNAEGGLTKEDLEATMKQMLMVSTVLSCYFMLCYVLLIVAQCLLQNVWWLQAGQVL